MAKKTKKNKKAVTIHERLANEATSLKRHFIGELIKLSTSSFGLIAALAWNELIKEVVAKNIKPFFGESSGVISLLIYAILVTLLAVLVTYNLSKLKRED